MKQLTPLSPVAWALAAIVALSVAGAVGCGSHEDTGVLSPAAEEIGDAAATREWRDASSCKSPEKLAAKTVKKLLKGKAGGEVVNGKHKVKFAPGAFEGEQTICVTTQPSGEVVLGPHGLVFSASVELSIDLGGTVWDSPAATIDWWDPSAGVWVDMSGVYDSPTRTVTATLPHFSTYRPRAGW